MAKTKERKPRGRKQPPLPGMEEHFIQELDDAAAAYMDVMLERCKLSKQEDQSKTELLAKMIENGKTRYTSTDGIVVDILDKKTVRAKKAKEAEVNGDAD